FDINLRAGFGDDPLDRFAAGADECADFFRINFDCLDPRRVLAQIGTRFIERRRHDAENLRARFFRAEGRFAHDLVADAWQFQIELEPSNALIGSAKFVIHVAEMIFGTDNVGEQLVAFEIAAIAKLRDETDGNSRYRRLDRYARIHEREHSTAHARHRG